MTTTASRLFTDADRARIQHAVEEAELRTAGEIVPFVVDASDDYEEAEWRFGALCGGAVLSLLAAAYALTTSWSPWNLLESLVGILIAFGAGMLLVRFVPGLKRVFAGSEIMEHRAGLRAWQAFVAEEVFRTRERTGILLFVSLLEHKVIVLGDSGINGRVERSHWESVVEKIVAGLRDGRPTDGLLAAIRECGVLLESHGIARKKDDADELSDGLRTADR